MIQDCLQICNNILHDSETCQRLFFGLGTHFLLKLVDFFDPQLLENYTLQYSGSTRSLDSEDEDNKSFESSNLWFEQPTRLAGAILAMNAINNSLSITNIKHQNEIMNNASVVISSALHWIARKGPVELVNAALSLIYRIVENNPSVANYVCNLILKLSPPLSDKNIPNSVDIPSIVFGTKLDVNNEKKISIPAMSLLAERYIYAHDISCWDSSANQMIKDSLTVDFDVLSVLLLNEPDSFSRGCLCVFEKILSVNSTLSDLFIQFILAPPPPPAMEDDYQEVDSGSPLGILILHLLVDGCNKIQGSNQFSTINSNTLRNEIDIAERVANIFTVIFVFGSQLAREIATAITTNHSIVNKSGNYRSSGDVKHLLPLLLTTASKTNRIPNGGGYNILIAILRMVSTIVSGCERAARQVWFYIL